MAKLFHVMKIGGFNNCVTKSNQPLIVGKKGRDKVRTYSIRTYIVTRIGTIELFMKEVSFD